MTTTTIGSLFTGYAGLDLAVQAVYGGTLSWHSEIEPAACRILEHRWPEVANLGDITTVDWSTVPRVDILTGGFPCQDLSHAGIRKGMRPGTRSGLWAHMAYAIDALRPPLVVIENVRGLLSAEAHSDLERDCWCVGDEREPTLRALGAVLGDLADLGYDAQWASVRASDVGAPHQRFRVFITAHPRGETVGLGAGLRAGEPGGLGRGRPDDDGPPPPVADADGAGLRQPGRAVPDGPTHPAPERPNPDPGGVAPSHRPRPDEQRPDQPDDALWLLPSDAALAGGPTEADGSREPGTGDISGTWGPYAAAVLRWERVTGRVAPAPTRPHPKTGKPRLSPLAVEWMMGLPAGHVTDPEIGLSFSEQLKALGNGVVPQQAQLALALLAGVPIAQVAPIDAPLLPTPNPFHAGNTEEPDEWRARRADVFQRTGTRHGPALGVVAKSLLPGEVPLTPDTYMPDDD